TDQDITTRILGNTGFTFNILDGLKAKTSVGADILNVNRTSFFPSVNTRVGRDNAGELTLANRSSSNFLNENILTYNKQIGEKHFIDAVAGYTFQKEVNKYTSTTTRGITAASVDQATLQGGQDILTPFSNRREWLLESLLGRVNYNLMADIWLLLPLEGMDHQDLEKKTSGPIFHLSHLGGILPMKGFLKIHNYRKPLMV